MSTKIYNGLILRNCSLEEALKRLISIRPNCVAQAQTEVAKELAKKRALWLDMDANYHPIPKVKRDPAFWRLHEILLQAQATVQAGTREIDWDFTFNVRLFPNGRDLLALYEIENDAGFKEALKSIGFADYHYQNSCGKPENISVRTWKDREKAWEKVYRAGWGHAGFLYEVVTWQDIRETLWMRDLIANNPPSESHRRFEVALRLVGTDVEPFDPKKFGLMEYANLATAAAHQRAPHVVLAPDLND